MATVIDLPNVPALAAIDPHRRFICMVALCAANESVDQVRFESRPDGWAILRYRDGGWVEFLPSVDRPATVGRTLRALTRRPGLLGWLGLTGRDGFLLRVGPAGVITCRTTRDGDNHLLAVEAPESVVEPAGELLWGYINSRSEQTGPGTADAGGEAGPAPDPVA